MSRWRNPSSDLSVNSASCDNPIGHNYTSYGSGQLAFIGPISEAFSLSVLFGSSGTLLMR